MKRTRRAIGVEEHPTAVGLHADLCTGRHQDFCAGKQATRHPFLRWLQQAGDGGQIERGYIEMEPLAHRFLDHGNHKSRIVDTRSLVNAQLLLEPGISLDGDAGRLHSAKIDRHAIHGLEVDRPLHTFP